MQRTNHLHIPVKYTNTAHIVLAVIAQRDAALYHFEQTENDTTLTDVTINMTATSRFRKITAKAKFFEDFILLLFSGSVTVCHLTRQQLPFSN